MSLSRIGGSRSGPPVDFSLSFLRILMSLFSGRTA